jgi:hypothetical protein
MDEQPICISEREAMDIKAKKPSGGASFLRVQSGYQIDLPGL